MSYRFSVSEALTPPFWTWGGSLIGAVIIVVAGGLDWLIPGVAAFVLWYGLLITGGMLNHFGFV